MAPDEQHPDRADASADAEPQDVPSPTIPPPSSSPTARAESQTPPLQEPPPPPPTLQRWIYGVGGAVILFAIVWALINAL